MTKGEAIRIISGEVLGTTEQTNEAVAMAVEALSAQSQQVTGKLDSDCISRQAAIDAVDVKCLHRGIVKGLQEIIKDLPPAQPEIIRCKDCRYYQDNNNGYPHMDCKWNADETPDADDFCSGAERKDNG